MIIREAKPEDLNSILEVLRASLGETSSRKNEAVWNYKHVLNPFGKSLVLVAEENAEIIGLRAFMRWKWQKGEKVFNAFRAVDTATHPNHQGKGVFKKLTFAALDIAKNNGDHFVFNTPNSQSKPGYIKMGWKEIDKLSIQLRPLNPLISSNNSFNYEVVGEVSTSKGLINSFFQNQKYIDKFFTPKLPEYLIWRYIKNPLQKYCVIFDENYLVAGYVKKRAKFNEFRIAEVISSTGAENQTKSAILNMANSSGAGVLSMSPNCTVNFKLGITGNFGPVLTFRNINLNRKEEQEFLGLSHWDYSIGDLELF